MSLNCSRLFYLVKTGFSWDDQPQWQAGVASALPDGKCLSLAPKPTDTSGLWAAPAPQQQTSYVPQWPAPIASQEPFYHIDLLSQEDSWVRSYGFEQPGVGGVLFPSCWQGAHCPQGLLWEGEEHADPEQAAARTAVSLEKTILVFSKPLSFGWTQPVPKCDGTRSTSWW